MVHRLFSSSISLFKNHKIHHELIQPVSIGAEYSHFSDIFLTNVIPSALGIKILGKTTHFCTVILWVILRVTETLDGHCGYESSLGCPYRLLPLSGSAEFHNYHHTHNSGNFGSFFTFWDSLMGTSKRFFNFIGKVQKEEECLKMKNKYCQELDKEELKKKT